MQARVFAVGTELLAERSDTNGQGIGRRLSARGYELTERRQLPDDEVQLAAALREALGRGGLLVACGGLGPTEDDVTRQALARAAGRELAVHEPTARDLQARARAAGREAATAASLRQASMPSGVTVLPNPNGTAPAFVLSVPGAVALVLPGPPHELLPLLDPGLDAAAEAAIAAGLPLPDRGPEEVELRVAGVGESDVAQRLHGLPELQPGDGDDRLDVAWLTGDGTVSVHLRSRDSGRLAAAAAAARQALGEAVYSDDGRTLAEVVVGILAEREETVGTVESCTGGLVAAEITSVPGSSRVLRRGLVTYGNEAKVLLAGVPPSTIDGHGAVSTETVEAMVRHGRDAVASDWVLATSGIAGPGGGTPEKPVGLVHVAVSGPDGTVSSERRQFSGPRRIVRARSVVAVLDLLRRHL